MEFPLNLKMLRYDNLCFIDDGMAVAGTVFGALHCFAWNLRFPTLVERLLWRMASVASAGILPVYHLLFVLRTKLGWRWLMIIVDMLIRPVLVIFYVLARLCLIMEAFRTLLYLLPESFVSTWSTQVPHLS
jgi:hypothetical protein